MQSGLRSPPRMGDFSARTGLAPGAIGGASSKGSIINPFVQAGILSGGNPRAAPGSAAQKGMARGGPCRAAFPLPSPAFSSPRRFLRPARRRTEVGAGPGRACARLHGACAGPAWRRSPRAQGRGLPGPPQTGHAGMEPLPVPNDGRRWNFWRAAQACTSGHFPWTPPETARRRCASGNRTRCRADPQHMAPVRFGHSIAGLPVLLFVLIRGLTRGAVLRDEGPFTASRPEPRSAHSLPLRAEGAVPCSLRDVGAFGSPASTWSASCLRRNMRAAPATR